jgi:serine protease Do
MKPQVHKPLIWFVALLVLVSLACGSSSATEEPPTQAPPPPPTQTQATEDDQPVEPPSQPATGAVSTLESAKGAVIQIEAQGTFVDPEFGEVSGGGRGSGFIIDPSGIAVTNNHVVTGAGILKVWIGGDTSQTYNAKVLGVSECSDLAVIDIDGDGFPYLEWYSNPIDVGLEVYALGFPLGEPEYTLTRGVVSKASAPGETNWASLDSVIGHDALINPGNSGGPLVDNNGKVIAVNYRSRPDYDQYFAISADMAIPLVDKLRAGSDVDSIGVNGTAVVSDDGTLAGIWVYSVESGSPAEKTGIQGGDLITSMEGLSLARDGTMADYCDIIRSHSLQDTVAVEVLRFSSQEVLEGQLNGTTLQTSFSFGDTIDTGDGVDTGEVYSDYVTVTDDTGAIALEVPASWGDVEGTLWEADWGNVHFVAANVRAAPNLDDFYGYYAASGVDFAASKDWGDIGGYVQLLDGTRHWYEDDCELDGRYDYEDEAYEGKYDLWECTADSALVVLSSRPIADPLAYLTLVQVQIATDADIDALDRILKTFDVVGRLP